MPLPPEQLNSSNTPWCPQLDPLSSSSLTLLLHRGLASIAKSGQYDHVYSSIPERVLETFRAFVSSLIALERGREYLAITYALLALRLRYLTLWFCVYARGRALLGVGRDVVLWIPP